MKNLAARLEVGIMGPPEIREIRLRLALTRQELASECGVSPRTVEGWLDGRTAPTSAAVAHLQRLSKEALASVPFTYETHFAGRIAKLRKDFDLKTDYELPKAHRAIVAGKVETIVVDHDATGTMAPGTGDTVVRRKPKTWTDGDRRFAQ